MISAAVYGARVALRVLRDQLITPAVAGAGSLCTAPARSTGAAATDRDRGSAVATLLAELRGLPSGGRRYSAPLYEHHGHVVVE
jgi:hypothetical protein